MNRILAAAVVITALGAPALHAQSPKPDPDGTMTLCAEISGPFRFCGSAPEFALTPQGDNADVTAYYTTPEGIQVAVIIEPLGSDQGLTVEGLQRAALTILSGAAGVPMQNIPVLERTTLIVDGVPRPNFAYRGNVGGVNFVYSNTMVLLDNSVAQFITIDDGTMVVTGAHRDLHLRLLANAQVNR